MITFKEKHLIQACLQNKEKAQTELYDLYKSKMYVVCLRYARNEAEANDFLVEGFYKVFRDLHQYNYQSPIENWIKKVIINTALMTLRKKELTTVSAIALEHNKYAQAPEIWQQLEVENILKAIQKLPSGYRTIFNLYAIEGYAHKEISDLLGISESTSRSQYTRAKSALQELLLKNEAIIKDKI